MTSEVSNAIAEAFREHRDAFGVSITMAGQTVTAIVNENALSRELVEGGFAESGNLQVKALLADFSTVPAIGAAASYNGRAYTVTSRMVAPGATVGEFEITPSSR